MMLGCTLGTQAQTTLTLDDSEDLVSLINEAAEAGGTYNVTFSDRPINLDSWNVLCLPFDIRPAQFTKYLGTVVVDLLDVNSDEDGNIHFEPTASGTIAAGTPFIINVGKLKRTPTNFNKVTFKDMEVKQVEASYTETDISGNRFISTFSHVEFYGEKFWYMTKGVWKDALYFTEANPVHLKPLRCYVDFTENTTTPAPKIIIREPDGTTTTIDAATFNTCEFSTKA